MYTIKQLPSGFWSIWIGETWIDASCRTRQEAEQKAQAFCKSHLTRAGR